MEVLKLSGKGPSVLHPQSDGLLQGARDVQQDSFTAVSGGQVQGPVEVSLLAAAGGLAARAGALDEGATEERLVADHLGQSGAGAAFWVGAVRAMGHGVSSTVLT